jgi:hypothetical protein
MLRLATKEDLNTLVDFANSFHSTTPYNNLSFDRDKVTLFINSLIETKNKSTIIVLEIEDKAVGCIIGIVEEVIFGLDLMSSELMFWVEEPYRGKDSWELIKAYEYWAKEIMQCKSCCLSRLEDSIGDKLDIKYKKDGYVPMEHTYMKVF